ncbi:MAG: phosphotransferase [Coriobacteriia bacterium]|nr:phosphotransferase [Coriobacteriia bacterium]
MLTQKQFNLLYVLKKFKNKKFNQRELAAHSGMSLGSVNAELKDMIEQGLITIDGSYKPTKKGLAKLKPYKVDNAIILAAGFSSRFAPISYELPKGKLEVKGEILIERQIKQLINAGIKEIYLVLGYLKEEFFYLEDMFKEVTLLFNEDYAQYNNISSILVARKHLKNTYICSSDNYFIDNPFESHVYQAYYSCVYHKGPTDEYMVHTVARDRIGSVDYGGRDGYIMLGEAYWTPEFSEPFLSLVDEDWKHEETRHMLWEDVYINHIDELDLYMKDASEYSVWEFDSIDDVKALDPNFVLNSDSEVFRNICKALDCKPGDINGFLPINKGLTNRSFSFYVHGRRYVYRHPGYGTDTYINRRREKAANEAASKLGIDQSYFMMSKKKGWKIAHFEDNFRELDYRNFDDLDLLFEKVFAYQKHKPKKLSQMKYMEEGKNLLRILRQQGRMDESGFLKLEKKAHKLYKEMLKDGYKDVFCHHDLYAPNLMISLDTGELSIIDWEYAGMDDPASDFATLMTNGEYTLAEAQAVLDRYYNINPKDKPRDFAHYIGAIGINSYFWFIWAIYKEMLGNPLGTLQYYYYSSAKKFISLALALYKHAKDEGEVVKNIVDEHIAKEQGEASAGDELEKSEDKPLDEEELVRVESMQNENDQFDAEQDASQN